MKKLMTLTLLMLVTLLANAQMLNPVKLSSTLKTGYTRESELNLGCKIIKGGK